MRVLVETALGWVKDSSVRRGTCRVNGREFVMHRKKHFATSGDVLLILEIKLPPNHLLYIYRFLSSFCALQWALMYMFQKTKKSHMSIVAQFELESL